MPTALVSYEIDDVGRVIWVSKVVALLSQVILIRVTSGAANDVKRAVSLYVDGIAKKMH
jgi:hypothetical protein